MEKAHAATGKVFVSFYKAVIPLILMLFCIIFFYGNPIIKGTVGSPTVISSVQPVQPVQHVPCPLIHITVEGKK